MAALTPSHLHPLPEEFVRYVDAGVFTTTEYHSARVIVDTTLGVEPGQAHFLDYLSVAVAVWAPMNGHVCANLETIQRQVFEASLDAEEGAQLRDLTWPDHEEWISHLTGNPLVGAAVEAGIDLTKPLVLRGTRLYLTRQWIDEGDVARDLARRFALATGVTPDQIDPYIEEIGWKTGSELQQDAVRAALRQNTSVLLGGPGTGKTYTITAILHTLLSHHRATGKKTSLRIAVAAPTAKASRQINASIDAAVTTAAFPSTFKDELLRIGQSASTLHKLLGFLPYARTRFKHNRNNHLPYDVVVIDEVSMVSLSLMARLLEALSPETQLILVGDGEQLKSVENGAVLPEIAELARMSDGFPITVLTHNQRQGKNAIAQLATAIRNTDQPGVESALSILGGKHPEIYWLDTSNHDATNESIHTWLDTIDDDLKAFREAHAAAKVGDAESALDNLNRLRVLCAYRRGVYGVREWNRALAGHLGIDLRPTATGLPLLNTRNDIRTGLVNGDTGIIVRRGTHSSAVFRVSEQGPSTKGMTGKYVTRVKDFEPTALESVEYSFATTVHKAQGSQYDTTIVVCPPEGSALATRELLYTAITRAVNRLVIIGSEKAITDAINTRIPRESELAARIRGQ